MPFFTLLLEKEKDPWKRYFRCFGKNNYQSDRRIG